MSARMSQPANSTFSRGFFPESTTPATPRLRITPLISGIRSSIASAASLLYLFTGNYQAPGPKPGRVGQRIAHLNERRAHAAQRLIFVAQTEALAAGAGHRALRASSVALPQDGHLSTLSGRSFAPAVLSKLGSGAQAGQARYLCSISARTSFAG